MILSFFNCAGNSNGYAVTVRAAIAIYAGLGLASCQQSSTRTTASNATAAPKITAAPVAAKTTSTATAPPISIRTPVHDQPSFSLARVVSGIKRGTTIATFPRKVISFGGACNATYYRDATLDWATGTREFGDWRSEFGDIFFEVLRDGGVNVVGDPNDLFDQKDAARTAEYLVGARIRKLEGKFCEAHRWLTGRASGKYRGEFSIHVEWSVYSALSKQTVARFETRGYFRQRKAKLEGIQLTFLGAFSSATESLLKTPQFVHLVERKSGVSQARLPAATGTSALPDEVGEFSPVEIERERRSSIPIRRIVGGVTGAVVSVRAGHGHGSGFMIDRSGLLLTNEHVVGKAQRVQVVFSNGLEVSGMVVRRDPAHDVALVRLPVRARKGLPLRKKPAQRLEDVYAIGSPMHEALAGTITRGVVSAVRVFEPDGIRLIQADVAISGGNSGGPLLDRFGNVVGISVASIVGGDAQNLNLFIPINDALEALNIVYKDARVSGR